MDEIRKHIPNAKRRKKSKGGKNVLGSTSICFCDFYLYEGPHLKLALHSPRVWVFSSRMIAPSHRSSARSWRRGEGETGRASRCLGCWWWRWAGLSWSPPSPSSRSPWCRRPRGPCHWPWQGSDPWTWWNTGRISRDRTETKIENQSLMGGSLFNEVRTKTTFQDLKYLPGRVPRNDLTSQLWSKKQTLV